MFPDNLYISDPTGGRIYVVYNDRVEQSFSAYTDIYGFLVAQNQLDFYTVNRYNNSITRYKQLVSVGDIPVGRTPWGICEDPSGKIYVTNYTDNTVSLIKDGVEVQKIAVDRGPRGIVSDNNGTIWVACYISNTVVKIVNNIVVDRVKVPYQPEGITCSYSGEVYVTCSGSNVVVLLKRDGSHLTMNTGKCPVAVVCDKKGHVFTANFEDDTVSQISPITGETHTIPVGDGPSAIAITSNGMVYVTSNLSGELIYKINPATAAVVDTIEVCKGQSAFGDFTGCATYNCFNPNGGGGSSVVDDDVINVVKSLTPTFEITDFVITDEEYKIKVDSKLFDLTKFNHMKLNGVGEVDVDGYYTIPVSDIGSTLTLTGYYDEDDSDPVTFDPLKVNGLFEVEVGLLDDEDNYTSIKTVKVDFNAANVVAFTAIQQAEGRVVVGFTPTAFDDNVDGLLVQGMINAGTAWAGENLAVDNSKTNLINPLVTNASEKWLFQIFKLN